MQITINVEAKYVSAIADALASIHNTPVTDEQVAKFIEMDLNNRYGVIHDNNGFDDEIGMMLDELDDYFF
jgi:hypothetical protein